MTPSIDSCGPLFSLDSSARTGYERRHMHGRILIAIPAYNEEQTIIQAIRDLKAYGGLMLLRNLIWLWLRGWAR